MLLSLPSNKNLISCKSSFHFTIPKIKMHGEFHLHFLSLFFFFIILSNLPLSKSEIRTIHLLSDDRAFIFLQDFGFKSPGYISLSISAVSVTPVTPTRLSFMGFFYGPTPARPALMLAILRDSCILGAPFVFPILKLDEKSVRPHMDLKKTVLVTIPDLYYIFFVNCAKNSSVSMTVNLETYNVGDGRRDYMDKHFADLPRAVFVFSLTFFVFVITWSYACSKNKRFLNRLHILMALLLLLRFLELVCYANSLHAIRLTGSAHFLNVLWFGLYFARSMLFVVVIVLIRAGWSIYRPRLHETHKYIISMAISLQIVASICFVLMRGAGPSSRNYTHWAVTFYSLDFLCCVVLALPVGSVPADRGSKLEGKEAKALMHERVFRNFTLAVYAYVGSTRIGIFVWRCMAGHHIWCSTIVLEMAVELVFYLVVYYMFWPNERYDYVVSESREDENSAAICPGIELDL